MKIVYHYFSFIYTLKPLIVCDEILSEIYKTYDTSDIIRDFSDGNAFKENTLSHKDCNDYIQNQLYFDEFTATNALNSNSKEYKIAVAYFILGYLDPKYKFRFDNINLLNIYIYR